MDRALLLIALASYGFFGFALGAPAQSNSQLQAAAVPVNKGLVALGVIPSDARDSFGETLGGFGSAISIQRGSFQKTASGFNGTLICQPDRGFNVDGTIDFQARQHRIDFQFQPYTSSARLSYADAKNTMQLQYKNTILYSESDSTRTSGLDPTGVRHQASPVVDIPIASPLYNHISLDAEGLVQNSDGSFWVSDEYGPYVYHISSDGTILSMIQPPTAILPKIGGQLNFTATIEPDSGRSANQGLEGLTASPDGNTLYGMLQSAIKQDGGGDKDTNRHARLFAWDVTDKAFPSLKNEWVVKLAQNSKGKTLAQSEIHYLSPTQFLVLARDGNGHGDTDSKSDYKSIDIIDVTSATDIHGTLYDTTVPVAPNGKLATGITAATYTPFVSLIDSIQLARFGLHNGGAFDETLIDAKWESLALAPALDPAFPDDYFLFTAADNDFITTNGFTLGHAYNAGQNVDTQIFIFRVTLPNVARGSVEMSIGL